MAKKSQFIVVLLIFLGQAIAWGQTKAFLEPEPPIEIQHANFLPCDNEVDSYIRVVRARERFGVSGKGLKAAVIDSGINDLHVDFLGKIQDGEKYNFSNIGDPQDVRDTNGHGSNCAGIIAGHYFGNGGMHTGIAYDAGIVPLKVFPGGEFTRINNALEWIRDHGERLGISVVNMSLGTQDNLTTDATLNDPELNRLRALVKELREKDIVVVASAGNRYKGFNSQEGMAFPAIFKETISVGAIYDSDIDGNLNGTPLVSYIDAAHVVFCVQNRCTVFTQRLGEQIGGEHRTDIFAPGFLVTSAGPIKMSNGQVDPVASRRTETTQDGTSQAGPVVSGIVLLLQERFRRLNTSLGNPSSQLPPVALVERCLFEGGTEFQDVEDDIAQRMDNVVGCGATFRSVDAIGALSAMDRHFQSELTSLRAETYETLRQGKSIPAQTSNKASAPYMFQKFKVNQKK